MSIRLTVSALVMALTFALPAAADPLAEGIAALPGAVDDVRIGGTWELDDRSGVYRVVVARTGGEPVTARLFVQWVAFQDEGSAPAEATLEIDEFADLGVDIVDYTSESDQDGLAVYLRTLDPGGAADQVYELFVFSQTEYLFGLASN